MGGSEGPATEAAGFSAPGDGAVYELTMPKLGETVTEGTISSWLKQVGDEVAFDDPLFEVSTDKVDSEIPSPYDGVLLEILVQADETVPVGTVLARIGDSPGRPPPARHLPGAVRNPRQRHRRQRLPGRGRPAGRQRGRSTAVPAGAQARCRARTRPVGDTGYRSRWADPSRGRGEGGRRAGRTPRRAGRRLRPRLAAPAAAARAVKAAHRRPATKWCRCPGCASSSPTR